MDAKDIQVVNDEVQIKNGDFYVNDSDQQHVEHILKANPGQFYQHPLIGVGVFRYTNASVNPSAVKQRIKLHLKSDNYRIDKLVVKQDPGGPMETYIAATRLK
jgi:hypothetical protein